MTREEAVAVLKALMENPLFSEVHKIAFNIAIHDIKAFQDWNINNVILVNKDNYEPLEQEPTTKNDLGVDCISRADVNQVIEDYMDEQYRVLSDRTRERAFGANAVKARINELQTVTLEPKIGHERLTNSEWIDFLSEQFDISRTSAKEMLHTMMSVKKEDNFKKLFSRGKVYLVKAESEDKE